ncbi:MAG: type II toxin-antitoxin system VapC family toxin [Dehalococcoidia bacterium]
MTLIVDASVVLAGLITGLPDGRWAEEQLLSTDLVAPHHMLVEVANTLRGGELAGDISATVASSAFEQLMAMRFDLYPFEMFADRIWQLRANVTPADAWYVALAEWMNAPLATLDRRLVRAPGPRCVFLKPETDP